MTTSANAIIQQLDRCAGQPMGFPHFGTFFPVDARLSVYRDAQHWAIAVNTIVFNDGPTRHDCINSLVFCYGDSLPESPGVRYHDENLTRDGPSGPLFDPNDILGHIISGTAHDLTIRGQVVTFTNDLRAYSINGITLRDPPNVYGYELLRLITPKHRELLLATGNELAAWLGRDMPLLLRLEEWEHPDNERGETPGTTECFRLIADAIEANSPLRYKPSRPPNTHWSNWPNAGIL
jgi:hypothetical protein